MKKLLVTTVLVMLCALGLGEPSPRLPLVPTAHAQLVSPAAGDTAIGSFCQVSPQLAARVIPAIIGGDGVPCTLQFKCNQECLAMARQICEAECGGRGGPCYNTCLTDYRGDCCVEVCDR